MKMILVTDTRFGEPRRVLVNMAHVEAITDDERGANIVFHRNARDPHDDGDWEGGALPVAESFDELVYALEARPTSHIGHIRDAVEGGTYSVRSGNVLHWLLQDKQDTERLGRALADGNREAVERLLKRRRHCGVTSVREIMASPPFVAALGEIQP